MDNIKFEIKTYDVEFFQSAGKNTHTIHLVSPNIPNGHGIHYQAWLTFVTHNPFDPNLGTIQNLGAANFKPIKVSAFMDLSSFASFYQLMSTEKPVSLEVGYVPHPDNPKGTSKLITYVKLVTDIEMPGDADKDPFLLLVPFGSGNDENV